MKPLLTYRIPAMLHWKISVVHKQLCRIYFSILGNIVVPLKLPTSFCFPDLNTTNRRPPVHVSGKSLCSMVYFGTIVIDSFRGGWHTLINSAMISWIPARLNLFLPSLLWETLLPKLRCSLKFRWLLFPCTIQYLVLYSYHIHSGS